MMLRQLLSQQWLWHPTEPCSQPLTAVMLPHCWFLTTYLPVQSTENVPMRAENISIPADFRRTSSQLSQLCYHLNINVSDYHSIFVTMSLKTVWEQEQQQVPTCLHWASSSSMRLFCSLIFASCDLFRDSTLSNRSWRVPISVVNLSWSANKFCFSSSTESRNVVTSMRFACHPTTNLTFCTVNVMEDDVYCN